MTNVYICRFHTLDLDLLAFYFDLLIPFPFYRATKPVYICTGNTDLLAFYFNLLILFLDDKPLENNITSDMSMIQESVIGGTDIRSQMYVYMKVT
jgi:hypothetical protein